MKKQNKWKYWIFSFMMMMFYCFPVNTIYATKVDAGTGLEMKVEVVKQNGGKLQPGDSFSVDATVDISGYSSKEHSGLYFSEATVSGAVTSSTKPNLVGKLGEKLTGDGVYEFTVTGLVYSGQGDSISVGIQIDSNGGDSEKVFSQVSDSFILSAYTSSDFADTLVVEKQDNIVVKTDQTQSIEVKITNKGNFTVNQAEAKLSLNSKVEGLTIKNDTSKVTNIKSKEVKNAKFSIAVDKEIKAGVYPATVTVLGNSYSVNIQVDSNVVPSALEISVGDKSVYTPGVEKTASFIIKNVGDRDAKNVRLELVNTENVAVVENSNVKRINLLKAKSSETITMKVRISSNYKGDSVAIPIKFNYLSSTGEQAEDTQYVYLYTNNTTAASEVVISNVISPTSTFGVDENFTVKFNISAKSAAESVQISVEGDEGIVPKSQNLFFVNKLASGESKQYSVSFAATRAAVSSSHPIKITVTYGTGETPTTINQYGSVNISNPQKDKEDDKEDDETLKGKPKVIIEEYEINPTIVQAGDEFVLTMGFLNTSSKHTVHNLKANILPVTQEKAEDTGNVFTPVDGSNTIYIADLATGEMATKVLNMYTIPSATAKTYQITVEMAYEDEEGNEITATETLGIPVEQVTKIEVGDVYVDMGQVGMETAFSVTFYNRGRTNINNMMVYLKGEGFEVQENKTFIGTFEMGESEIYEPIIIPNQAGTLKGTLVIEYEDPSGEEKTLEHEFEFQADEMMMEEMGDMNMEMDMMGEEEKSNQSHLPLYIGIGVGVFVALIILIVVLKKKKAKKEARLLDEED